MNYNEKKNSMDKFAEIKEKEKKDRCNHQIIQKRKKRRIMIMKIQDLFLQTLRNSSSSFPPLIFDQCFGGVSV